MDTTNMKREIRLIVTAFALAITGTILYGLSEAPLNEYASFVIVCLVTANLIGYLIVSSHRSDVATMRS